MLTSDRSCSLRRGSLTAAATRVRRSSRPTHDDELSFIRLDGTLDHEAVPCGHSQGTLVPVQDEHAQPSRLIGLDREVEDGGNEAPPRPRPHAVGREPVADVECAWVFGYATYARRVVKAAVAHQGAV